MTSGDPEDPSFGPGKLYFGERELGTISNLAIVHMTTDEIKAARHALGMSVSEMADWLGLEGERGRDLIRDWEKGKKPITGPAARALKLASAPAYQLAKYVASGIPAGALKPGEWYSVQATMTPDEAGHIELEGCKFRLSEISITPAR
jgi:DNA-binding transcriptional regulator YiaG